MTAPVELHWVQRPGRSVGQVLRPSTVDQALALLELDPDRRPIAGGTDLLLELERGGAGPPVDLVDLSGIRDFDLIQETTGAFVLGGGVTHNQVVAHAGILAQANPLAQACLEIGSPQLRNRATIAGNLATASPANDTISALMALDASVELQRSVNGQLHIDHVPVEEFFVGFRRTVLEPGQLITAIRVPKFDQYQRGVWVKLGLRKAQAISVVHLGVVASIGDDGVVTAARVALGSVAETVVMSPQASAVLVGSALTPDIIAAAAQAAADSVTPIDDVRATADYRSSTIATMVSRALGVLATDGQLTSWPQRVPRLSVDASAQSAPQAELKNQTEVGVVVNGTRVTAAHQGHTLLDWLRDNAGTGTKEGCAEGECGACTVTVDGQAVMSCLVLAAQADGAHVTTIEGLATVAEPHPMQRAFVEKFAVQCGYCIPGFVMAAWTLTAEINQPTRDEIELGLSGNLCRCTGYYTIIEAVQAAAQEMS